MASGRHDLKHVELIERIDRPRGILSKRDRQFLLDASYREDLAAQSQRNVRARLRERLRNAILDVYLLDEYLDERDRDRVFADIDAALGEGLHATLALLYRGANQNPDTFAAWLEAGLTHIELDHRSSLLIEPPTVNLAITPGQSFDPDTAEDKIEAGRIDELTPGELRFILWRVGKLLASQNTDTPLFRMLTEFVQHFEKQTRLADAREKRENKDQE